MRCIDRRAKVRPSWDEVYARELQNFRESGDEGEVWFGRRCERRIVDWIINSVPVQSRIIEFGSGNGHLLVALAKQGGFAELLGIDYSEDAIALARAYARQEGCAEAIHYVLGDLLGGQSGGALAALQPADLIIDKGTFDAICLSEPGTATDGHTGETGGRIAGLCSLFKASLRSLLRPAGASRFIITSCNWTREELRTLFQPELQLVDEIAHPSISFGGQKGQTVTTLVFK